MQTRKFDILIVGGGLVGNSLAWLLAQQRFQVAIVETKKPVPSTDNRSLVLTYSSYLILNAMGLWKTISEHTYPIRQVHVSQEGKFGAARFDAKNLGFEVFGYVVPMAKLTDALQQHVFAEKTIQAIRPATVIAATIDSAGANVSVEISGNVETLSTKLLIAADGTQSKIRDLLGIKVRRYDYQQSAIIAQINLQQAHRNVAYERLTPAGPLAMLPREEQSCGMVWTVNNNQLAELLAMDNKNFLAQLQLHFGYRLGKLINISERQSFPLQYLVAEQSVLSHALLLGNAAHTLHPIAGQGFNLALRDVAALAEILATAKIRDSNWNDFSVLNEYQQWRKQDQQRINFFTDRTVRIFTSDMFALKALGNLGLLATDLLPAIKRQLVQRLLGLTGRVPKLVCGVELSVTE